MLTVLPLQHNKYENDVSPTRPDLYELGNNFRTQATQFQDLINASPGGVVTINSLTSYRSQRFDRQIANNPQFFNAPFPGLLVQSGMSLQSPHHARYSSDQCSSSCIHFHLPLHGKPLRREPNRCAFASEHPDVVRHLRSRWKLHCTFRTRENPKQLVPSLTDSTIHHSLLLGRYRQRRGPSPKVLEHWWQP